MKKEFMDFLNALMEAAPDVAEELMTENVKAYIEALTDKKNEKPILTDNGKLVLKYLQNAEPGIYKAKDIADGLFVSSRNVSGAMRKLVTDGFVEKVGESPVLYTLTEKGKEFKIED
jgi:DNA-binding MarR family transcriptional regulator